MLVLQLPIAATTSTARGLVIIAVVALARRQELLLVVAELPDHAGYRSTGHFVAQLRGALPRFTITEVVISANVVDGPASRRPDSYALVADLLNDGGIAVTPTSNNAAPRLAASMSAHFGAEQLVLTADNAEHVANWVALYDGREPRSST